MFGKIALTLVSCAATVAGAAEITLTIRDLTNTGSGPLVALDIAGLPRKSALPAVDPADESAEARQLRGLVARGVSQGFEGILYDNRDREHSTLPATRFPNLTVLKYGPALTKRRFDYGLAGPILIPALVFGNSSTAMTSGLNARSQVRHAMTVPGGPARAYRDYRSNSLYVYPEHRDHDEVDLYPANWPYTTISQGSSVSDAPFMDAIAMTLAAFPADTRAALEENGLVAPTVQMILRRNLKRVRTRKNYMSSVAHPTVFSAEWLQPGRMIGQAAAMRPEDIPPLVRLKIVEEDFKPSAGLAGLDEHLFTTPSAIARVWRSFAWERQMIVTAEATTDPNGHPLQFDWVLLRGDPARVRIEPFGSEGEKARITLNWHDRFALLPHGPSEARSQMTSRVDIGVFAYNGKTDSAPAMVSISFPTHQSRVYEAGEGAALRLKSVDYDAVKRGTYLDPVLHWTAPWTDNFRYGADGEIEGWVRVSGETSTSFNASGQTDDGASVSYEIMRKPDEQPVLTEVGATANN